jgi:hypothetical protein
METALVEAGRIEIRKPGDRDYAVEVVANADFTKVQTEMVRYAATTDSTTQQRWRDKEREEAWCEDHARLRAALAERGMEASFSFKLGAGLKPVRVIADHTGQSGKRGAAAQPKVRQRNVS